MPDLFDNSLVRLINVFFDGMYAYAKLHPVLALCIMQNYFQCMAIIVEDASLSVKRERLNASFHNEAMIIQRMLDTENFVKAISPLTHVISSVAGGTKKVADVSHAMDLGKAVIGAAAL